MSAPIDLSTLPVEFVGSFPDPDRELDPALPELVFLGRSNVGKSTLINALAGRRIARTSNTPGKTEHLVVFRFPTFYLLDLPGYGYAKRPHTARQQLRQLVDRVIEDRRSVRGVVWLLDLRHPPSKDDLAMRDLLVNAGRQTIVTLTKADKLTRSEQVAAVRNRATELEIAAADLIVTSSAKGTGIADLTERVWDLVGSP